MEREPRARVVPTSLALVLALGGCGTTLGQVRGWTARCDQDALVDALRSERSWVRRAAARGLGVCRIGAARTSLEAIAVDPDERRWVRSAAVRALGVLGAEPSLGVLEGLAADPRLEPEVQLEVIGGLERLGARTDGACAALAPLAERDEPLVSARAELAIGRACARSSSRARLKKGTGR